MRLAFTGENTEETQSVPLSLTVINRLCVFYGMSKTSYPRHTTALDKAELHKARALVAQEYSNDFDQSQSVALNFVATKLTFRLQEDPRWKFVLHDEKKRKDYVGMIYLFRYPC